MDLFMGIPVYLHSFVYIPNSIFRSDNHVQHCYVPEKLLRSADQSFPLEHILLTRSSLWCCLQN